MLKSSSYPGCSMSFLLSALILAGCASYGDQQTMRVCDDTGCHERSVHHASFSQESTPEEIEAERKIKALEELAKDNPRAAYDLGLRFFRGDGVRQDSYLAIKWMRQAAEQGELAAQKALGQLYLTGLEEMGADYREAEKWLDLAASRGDKESAELLQEAREAKTTETGYYSWQQRWRPYFYRYWYSGYNYYWRWGARGWYY